MKKVEDGWFVEIGIVLLVVLVLALCVVFGSIQEKNDKESCEASGGAYSLIGKTTGGRNVWGCVKL